MKKIVALLLLTPFLTLAQYAEYDWEERDTWMDVDVIFEAAGIYKGSYVADIGCHEGYLSIHLANQVGTDGLVFAVDVRQDRLESLQEHLDDRELENVNVILGDYDNPKLPENTLDVVVIMDTYHEMTDYKDILNHVYKALKPGGRLLILEKLKDRVKNASRNAQTDAHTIAPKYVRRELKAADFEIVDQRNNLGDWENDETKPMWLIVAKKPL